MDWVERRFARERHMENGPKEVWQQVLTAVDNACRSFQSGRTVPKVFQRPENGHVMLVTVEWPRRPFPDDGVASINYVRLTFDHHKPAITSTFNDKATMSFSISADEDGCFLQYGGSRIDADKLSQLALEDALFNRPNPKPQFASSPEVPYWDK